MPTKQSRIFFTALFFCLTGVCLRAKADDADSLRSHLRRLGLFDLNAGTTWRSANQSQAGVSTPRFSNHAAGFSARMQSSVLWSLRADTKTSRFSWGDILAGEVFAGTLSTAMQHETGNVWLAYHFDFGFGGRFIINDNSEIGLNLLLLKFSRDNVSGNISGSGILGRYRFKQVLLEAGIEARQTRALGVIIDARDKVPLQHLFAVRYLLSGGKNFGLNVEQLSGNYLQNGFQYSRIWSVKLFYGIYF